MKSSDQDWNWLFRIDRGTARQGGDAATPMVRPNKDGDMPKAVEIESNGQLQHIKSPQALTSFKRYSGRDYNNKLATADVKSGSFSIGPIVKPN